jgi:hypothetical protein
METRSRKRKWEEMQNPDPNPDPMHEISWHGERLPVELWTRVFYYLLVPVSRTPGPGFNTPHVKALQKHPLIAGIIHEFLLFRTGITYADLRGTRTKPYPEAVGSVRLSQRYWTPMNPKPTSMENAHQYSVFEIALRSVYHYTYISPGILIKFFPKTITIHIGFLVPTLYENPTSNMKFDEVDRHKFRAANRVLPYGLQFHQDRGILQIRMPNNPRLRDSEPEFRIVREFHYICMTNSRRETKFGFNVYCNISLDKLYIPTWRPYF